MMTHLLLCTLTAFVAFAQVCFFLLVVSFIKDALMGAIAWACGDDEGDESPQPPNTRREPEP